MAHAPAVGRVAACAAPTPTPVNGRLRVDVLRRTSGSQEIADDVRRGLLAAQKTLPPKYFYDDRGSALFEAICDLPEYYLSRVGQALLDEAADDIVRTTRPTVIVELGSGTSRKTRTLLDALHHASHDLCYVPMDVSEATLRTTALALLDEDPALRVHAIVGDYEHDLHRLPAGRPRLVLFLGSTIGNLSPAATAAFLRRLRESLAVDDFFLLGVDLVKPIDILEAAYNDRAGVTAEFNRNVLRVINRELDATFDVDRFEHLAFFNQPQSQIEMHLRARSTHHVSIGALQLSVPFVAGETIHTEISRKFTRDEVEASLERAAFALVRWYTPANNYFALALARAV